MPQRLVAELSVRGGIPRAIQISLVLTVAIYAAVAVTILSVLGPEGVAATSTMLVAAVEAGTWTWASPVVKVGGAAAALGALLEFDDGYAIVKTRPPTRIHDTPLGQTHIRSQYGVTIVGVKRAGQDFTHATAETVVKDGDLVIVSGPRDKVERFSEII